MKCCQKRLGANIEMPNQMNEKKKLRTRNCTLDGAKNANKNQQTTKR